MASRKPKSNFFVILKSGASVVTLPETPLMVSRTHVAQRQAETQVMTQSVLNLPSLGFPSSLPPGRGSYTRFLPGTKGGPTAASQAKLLQRKGVPAQTAPSVPADIQGRDRAALLRPLTLMLLLVVVSGASGHEQPI